MSALLEDLRFGARLLRKSPGFTVAAVTTLALGIGANSAIFSVVNAVLIRPLPYPRSERLVTLGNKYPKMGLSMTSWSGPDFADRRDADRVFDRIGVYTDADLNLTGGGEPERIPGARLSEGPLPALGVPPVAGRFFTAAEDRPGGPAVVLVSQGLWKRRFGGDPGLIGRGILLNGESRTVIGIMPAGFGLPSPRTEMWIPAALGVEQLDASQRGNEYLRAIARLKPGVTVAAAQAEMDRITRVILEKSPAATREYLEGAGWGCTVVPLKENLVGESRRALLILLGAVAGVLLIACANVANLQLARAAGREKEIAVRTALGAGRARLVRQLLSESLLLSAAGGGAGFLIAAWGVDLITAARPAGLPRLEEVSVDSRVLIFTAALSLLSGILSGLAPALQISRSALNESLKEGSRSVAGGVRPLRARQILVVSQVSLALLLLIGAGLMLRSFQGLQKVDPGFDPKNVLTLYTSLPRSRYPDPERIRDFFHTALERLRNLPGVTGAAAVSLVPLAEGNWTASFITEERPPGPGQSPPVAVMHAITPGYLRTMAIPLLRGRDLTDRDDAKSPGAVLIDAEAARRLWPGEDSIGKRITFSDSTTSATWLTVVGVVGEIRDASLDQGPSLHVYVPFDQAPQRSMFLAVRAGTDPAGLLAAVRREIRALDPDQPIYAVRTLEGYVSEALSLPRFRSALVGVFAAVALLLAALGIYAVISQSVTQRTHEIGIRMTLGARASDVMRLVMGQGVTLILGGVSIGIGAALGLTRLLSGLLYGIGARDPVTFAGVTLFLALVAMAACYFPARRASRVDPNAALRYE